MKATIAGWLLVLGVVIGALAAAGSKQAYRWIELDPTLDLSSEVLYETIEHRRVEGEKPLELAEGGMPLDVAALTRLVNAGITRVRVRHPAHDSEPVALDEAEGRVLNTYVEIHGETETFKDGRVASGPLVLRAREAGLATIAVRRTSASADDLDAVEDFPTADPPRPERRGDPYDERHWKADKYKGWTQPVPLTGPDAEDLGEGNLELAETLTLPRRIAKGTYLDDALIGLFREQGIESVSVVVTAPFSWSGWSQRWYFLGAVTLILVAIALKRGAKAEVATSPDGTTPVGEVWLALELLLQESRELAEAAPNLTADALHRAIDPIHSGSLYRIIDGRESVRASLGLAGYAHVFGPLAAGERMLNRAWSAAVDGYLEEARECAERAAPHFAEALSAWPKP